MENTEKNAAMRHSLAHLLATAVLELYPGTKNTIGPAIDTGFYYDFEFPEGAVPTEKDLGKIEQKMREKLKGWETFLGIELTAKEARHIFAGNPYKIELINEIESKGESITLYYSGPKESAPTLESLSSIELPLKAGFLDLCRGGHVEHPNKDIVKDGWKLERLAGAYWRGDEKNKMLTRIYGLAFESKEALLSYETQIEEARKRDHKKIGKDLGLFVFSELVGSGLPLWTPKGTVMRELLNDYVWELRKIRGFQKVAIPHITKKDLYEKSGHWAKFAEELFKIQTREGHLFAMKPMNCPHHTQIYDAEPKSYRDLPQRYCETTMVYRDEQSGELSGLSRVRSITQDDAHVFCRENQIETEILSIWDIIDTFYKTFGFDLQVRFSRHNPETFDKYLGTPEIWKKAEDKLKAVIEKRYGKNYIDGIGEAAMYGPKIDFLAKDALGRILQVATIQLDFNMPIRFELTCTNERGEKEPIVMIHCAIMGSIERFLSTLIEHYAGAFPFWLSPVQVSIIPIGDAHIEEAKKVHTSLLEAGIRSEFDESGNGFGKKVRAAKVMKIPYFIIIGDKDIEAKKITLESRDHGQLGQLSTEDVVQKLSKEIQDKK